MQLSQFCIVDIIAKKYVQCEIKCCHYLSVILVKDTRL